MGTFGTRLIIRMVIFVGLLLVPAALPCAGQETPPKVQDRRKEPLQYGDPIIMNGVELRYSPSSGTFQLFSQGLTNTNINSVMGAVNFTGSNGINAGQMTGSASTTLTPGAGGSPGTAGNQPASNRTQRFRSQSRASSKGNDFCCRSIFFATDRRPTGQTAAAHFFAGDHEPSERMSYGTCDVSVPIDHRIGLLESPSIWKLEFSPDRKKHVVLLNLTPCGRNKFFAGVAEAVRDSTRKEAFVFIHGYNVRFEDAARRTAQIAYDLAFDGPAILYSWPSRGKLHLYPSDEENVEVTIPHLVTFLSDLRDSTRATTIHLIAHSMGNRALTAALEQLAKGGSCLPFRQIVLTAPDINAMIFKRLAASVCGSVDRLTVYASPRDRALLASKRFHDHPRIGETIVVLPGVDTIDASSVDTSLLGHSYFAESRSVLADIYYLVRDGRPPSERFGMIARESEGGTYYCFRPS